MNSPDGEFHVCGLCIGSSFFFRADDSRDTAKENRESPLASARVAGDAAPLRRKLRHRLPPSGPWTPAQGSHAGRGHVLGRSVRRDR